MWELVKEHISFERGRDPKEALGLKLSKWEDLKPGYVLRSKVSFGRGDGGHIVRFNSFIQFYEGQYFLITKVKELGHMKFIYEIWFDLYDTLEDLRNKEHGEVDYGMYNINGTLRQFANKFDIIQNVYESSFERGRDPKTALGMGFHAKEIYDIVEKLKTTYTIYDIKSQLTEDNFEISFLSKEIHEKDRGDEVWMYILGYDTNIHIFYFNAENIEGITVGDPKITTQHVEDLEELEEKIFHLISL